MCVNRKPNMSQKEFQEYWLHSHGPLLKQFATTYKVKKYIQNHTIDTPLNENVRESRGMMKAYDGVAELWWESEKDFIEAITSPEGQKLRTVFLDDEAKFIDFSSSSAFFTEEYSIV